MAEDENQAVGETIERLAAERLAAKQARRQEAEARRRSESAYLMALAAQSRQAGGWAAYCENRGIDPEKDLRPPLLGEKQGGGRG